MSTFEIILCLVLVLAAYGIAGQWDEEAARRGLDMRAGSRPAASAGARPAAVRQRAIQPPGALGPGNEVREVRP